MKKEHWYNDMDSSEKREWWITLIGILCGLAGSFMALYYLTMAMKSAIQ